MIRVPLRGRLLRCLLLACILSSAFPAPRGGAQPGDGRFFSQTGYGVADDAFWDYFRRRGGIRTFGYPVSNPFQMLGFRVQIFQREVLQQRPDGSVTMMNILDEGLMPYARINGSTFPAPDQEIIARQPKVGSPDYHVKALQFVKDNAPDLWQGRAVNFFKTFSGSVTLADAFPDGQANPALIPGFNLEVWGLPTSKPTPDPTNAGFVYLRFQRGIMHYDASNGATQGLLLADYVKSLLTLGNLPPDLDAEARRDRNRLYGQWDPAAPSGVRRPDQLPASDLTNAFQRPNELTTSDSANASRRPSQVPASTLTNTSRREPIVLVDAGHGGPEIGTSTTFEDGTPLLEKDVNLRVATRVVALLRAGGVAAYISRNADAKVNATQDMTGDGRVTLVDDLQARVDMANQVRADLLVSVHFNGVSNPTKRGTQVFYADGRPFTDRSRVLAGLAQTNLLRYLKSAGHETIDRGATPDSRLLGHGSHFYLLGPASGIIKRPSEMPGIIGEPLFVTNPEDAQALRQEKIQDAVARAYADAIKAYFQRFPVS